MVVILGRKSKTKGIVIIIALSNKKLKDPVQVLSMVVECRAVILAFGSQTPLT